MLFVPVLWAEADVAFPSFVSADENFWLGITSTLTWGSKFEARVRGH